MSETFTISKPEMVGKLITELPSFSRHGIYTSKVNISTRMYLIQALYAILTGEKLYPFESWYIRHNLPVLKDISLAQIKEASADMEVIQNELGDKRFEVFKDAFDSVAEISDLRAAQAVRNLDVFREAIRNGSFTTTFGSKEAKTVCKHYRKPAANMTPPDASRKSADGHDLYAKTGKPVFVAKTGQIVHLYDEWVSNGEYRFETNDDDYECEYLGASEAYFAHELSTTWPIVSHQRQNN